MKTEDRKEFGMAETEEEAVVGTLSVKLPTFWPDMPEEWFGQAEANFRAHFLRHPAKLEFQISRQKFHNRIPQPLFV